VPRADALLAAADLARSEDVGDDVSFVVIKKTAT